MTSKTADVDSLKRSLRSEMRALRASSPAGEGYRLGYGGGYYDAFLSAFEGVSVGLCRKAQMSDSPLPRGPFDFPVDIVATDASACTCEAAFE